MDTRIMLTLECIIPPTTGQSHQLPPQVTKTINTHNSCLSDAFSWGLCPSLIPALQEPLTQLHSQLGSGSPLGQGT